MKYIATCIILMACFNNGYSQIFGNEWNVPPFLEVPRQEIVFHEYDGYFQVIDMDEEIQENVDIAKFNYDGDEMPQIGQFDDGKNNGLLGAEIQKREDGLYLVVTKKQDYETIIMRNYRFWVLIGEKAAKVALNIQNIKDNWPIVMANQSSCSVLEDWTGDATNCVFTISDPDEMISPNTYSVEEGRGLEALFEFLVYDDPSQNVSRVGYLRVLEKLDFRQMALYVFKVIATDFEGHQASATAVVEVENVPLRPPEWVTIFATKRFNEKEPQTFQVKAIDGDTNINKEINYELRDLGNLTLPGGTDLVTIGKETGTLSVKEIDRDTLEQEVFSFKIWAYKFDNYTWGKEETVVFVVDDINDQLPIINGGNDLVVEILEETILTLEFDPSIVIHDRDTGNNAMYMVALRDTSPNKYETAFNIVPKTGYQKADFLIVVIDAKKLDFEVPTWQNVQFEIVATETFDESRFQNQNVMVKLINWNDELPIFDLDTDYVVELNETIGVDELVGTVHASDRDIGDDVEHSLVGSINSIMKIDKSSGEIRTIVKDALDYEKQQVVVLQVLARDVWKDDFNTPLHSVFTQLTINVIDRNDETPEIIMPRTTPEVEENSPQGFLVIDLIKATDPDTTANLEFTIQWDETVAKKNGRQIKEEHYRGCFSIETVPDPQAANPNGSVTGMLYVQELPNKPGFTIDFEMFDIINLAITVEDLNQEINEGTANATLIVIIIDVNDNAPEFTGPNNPMQVIEESLTDTSIGSVFATDADGPPYNEVKYYLVPTGSTPVGLVTINEETGAITVDKNKAIDADIPKRYALEYVVIATDGLFVTPRNIIITITDTNNKNPTVQEESFDTTVSIKEDAASSTHITTIVTVDLDRDEPHNVYSYSIPYAQHPTLRKFFAVDLLTGEVTVRLESESLDRDNGITEHMLYVDVKDNYQGSGQTNSDQTQIRVILLDVNDNAPILPTPNGLLFSHSESTNKDTLLYKELEAPDKDEEDTPRSWVNYVILYIAPAGSNSPDVRDYDDLFRIEGDKKYGNIYANKNLKGYYGAWDVRIRAFDEPVDEPILWTEETYQVYVDPYNYNAPKIIFPYKEKIRLSLENLKLNSSLHTVDGSILQNFEAQDDDGGSAGYVDFSISGEDASFFDIFNINGKQAILQLQKQPLEQRNFKITLRAQDRGTTPGPKFSDMSLLIVLVNTVGEPLFSIAVENAKFTENCTGLTESWKIPEAIDPKNEETEEEDDKYPIYYFKLGDNKLFDVDRESGTITIADGEMLDYQTAQSHDIKIAATNNAQGPNANPEKGSVIDVIISVIDVNDNPPAFEMKWYSDGVTSNYEKDRIIRTVTAIDLDDEPLLYRIKDDTMEKNGTGLNDIQNPFKMVETTGQILLNFVLSPNMRGFFEFEIEVRDQRKPPCEPDDLPYYTDTAAVTIFIVSPENEVTFTFSNFIDDVKRQETFIREVFTTHFQYICNIERFDNPDQKDDENLTQVITHFIDSATGAAVKASVIEERTTDVSFNNRLEQNFLDRNLRFKGNLDTKANTDESRLEDLFLTILIVVSVVLGTFCILLIAGFIVKIRSFNRQMKAIVTTSFGSQHSGLNRKGLSAPNTNQFSVEGSNPVMNENTQERMFDRISQGSGDSDLIGIEDSPEFSYNEPVEKRDSINPVMMKEAKRKSLNPMAAAPEPVGQDPFTPKHN